MNHETFIEDNQLLDSHKFISARDLFDKQQAGEPVLLVDVRETAEFSEMHAKGARSVPIGSVSVQAMQKLDQYWDAHEHPVYLICHSGLRALQAAERLHQQGVTHPVVVEGGTGAWDATRLPMLRQKTAQLSLEQQTQIALGLLLMLILVKGMLIHPGFYLLVGLVAGGLLIAGFTAKCSLSSLLARMPWNQQPNTAAS